jgi:16S rRNA U516 pseudouridylate synthase RsuA-like enzyme
VSAQPGERAPAGRSRRAREPAARRVVQKVKLTEGERDQLRARAAELGVSVPRLLVESALAEATVTGTERRAEMVELFEVRRLLATVANNVNQLARVANTAGEVPVGQRLENAVEDVEAIVGRLRALTGARR